METQQGTCPNCGSEDLNYNGMSLDGEAASWTFECSDCGTKGVEHYNLVFVETVLETTK